LCWKPIFGNAFALSGEVGFDSARKPCNRSEMPLPAPSTVANGQASGSLRNANRGKRKVAQLLDLQAVLWTRALDAETANKDCAALACAWERLENRLGRLRMRPEPKPVDTEALAERKRKRAAPASLESFDPSKV
jgi:hypothetical protein